MKHRNPLLVFVADVKRYAYMLLRKWVTIALGAVLGAGIALLILQFQEVKYAAKHSFFINNEFNSDQVGLSSILGNVGLDYSDEQKKLEKIQIIAQSKSIIRTVLRDSALVSGHKDLIANHIVKEYTLDQKWKKTNPRFDNFRFTSEVESDLQKGATALLIQAFTDPSAVKDMSYEFTKDLKSGHMQLINITTNEELSYELNRRFFHYLSVFYKEKITEKPANTVRLLSAKKDSLRSDLEQSERRLAYYDTRNQSVWAPAEKVQREALQREVQLNTVAYAEVLKNLEKADFILQSVTPYFQVVDRPVKPLPMLFPSMRRTVITGLFLGAAATIILLIIRLYWTELLRNEEEQ